MDALTFQLNGNLDRLEQKLDNFAPVLKDFGDWWRDTEAERMFQSQSNPSGTAWSPLTEAYLAWKVREGLATEIGQATRETYKSRSYSQFGTTITLSFGTEQSQFFDEKRHLFPRDRLPASWERAIESIFEKYLED